MPSTDLSPAVLQDNQVVSSPGKNYYYEERAVVLTCTQDAGTALPFEMPVYFIKNRKQCSMQIPAIDFPANSTTYVITLTGFPSRFLPASNMTVPASYSGTFRGDVYVPLVALTAATHSGTQMGAMQVVNTTGSGSNGRVRLYKDLQESNWSATNSGLPPQTVSWLCDGAANDWVVD